MTDAFSPGKAPETPPPRTAAQARLQAESEGISLTRFLYVDHGGIVRGKAAATARLGERIESGIGHTRAMMAMSMMDELAPVDGMGPVGEVRIKPDISTFVTLPYAPGAAAMLADQVNPDGSSWDGCARTFLKRAIAELAAEGYELQASFEPEFSLGRHEGASFTPIDESLCYSATGFHLAHDYTIDLVDALTKQGLEVEHYYPELGHGQQEVPIRHAAALRAADNHVLLRETARAVAIRHGLWASFAPKPLPMQAGNGAHLHASLWADGGNAFADPAGQYGLSPVGYRFLAGVLAHLPGLVALTCGTVNSYRRLAPQMWSGAYACYGPDNREAAVRICSPIGSRGSVNLELKPIDSTGNPYLALGAFIYAGIDGIRRSLDPGEPLLVDPATLEPSERARLAVVRLPSSLSAALDALEADPFLMSALGSLRSAAYLAVKRSEVEHFAARYTETGPHPKADGTTGREYRREPDIDYECRQHWMKF
jgi:glutamine synthetase